MVKKVVSFIFAIILFITCLMVNVLPVLAYDVGDIVRVSVTGYISEDCYVAIVGDDHESKLSGPIIQANSTLTYNTSLYEPQYDLNGNPYLEVIVYSSLDGYVRCTYSYNGSSQTVNVPAYDYNGLDLPVGATNISLHIVNYDSGSPVPYVVYINLSDNTIPPVEPVNKFVIDFDKVDSSITNNYVLIYDGGRLSGDVTVDNKRLIVDLDSCLPLENEEGLYYTLYLSNVPVGSYFVVRQPNDVPTGYGGEINFANETFLIQSNSLSDYRFIVDYGTSNQIIDECEITIFFDSNIVDNYDAGYSDGFKAGQKYGESIGFDKGYAKGLEDSEGGLVNSFVQLLTNPIIAIMSFQLAEINGTTITVGAIFYTVLGIALVIAFIKLYAGG